MLILGRYNRQYTNNSTLYYIVIFIILKYININFFLVYLLRFIILFSDILTIFLKLF